jgi:hypothetical protein
MPLVQAVLPADEGSPGASDGWPSRRERAEVSPGATEKLFGRNLPDTDNLIAKRQLQFTIRPRFKIAPSKEIVPGERTKQNSDTGEGNAPAQPERGSVLKQTQLKARVYVSLELDLDTICGKLCLNQQATICRRRNGGNIRINNLNCTFGKAKKPNPVLGEGFNEKLRSSIKGLWHRAFYHSARAASGASAPAGGKAGAGDSLTS